MKTCSTCKEEFDRKFSFCPVDGTPLLTGGVRQYETNNHARALQLTGPQQGKLVKALLDAFDPERFNLMLFHRLNQALKNIAPINARFDVVVASVVERSNQEGWLLELILTAQEVVPGNPKLRDFMQEFGPVIAAGNDCGDLQAQVDDSLLDEVSFMLILVFAANRFWVFRQKGSLDFMHHSSGLGGTPLGSDSSP